jgi:hypothetical protein
VTEYHFDGDPASGTWETFEYDEATGNVTIRQYADVQPALDYNKSFHLTSDGKGKDMWLAASIPDTIALKWLRDYGVNAWRADHWPAVKRLLEDPEWRHLRPTSFRL